MTHYTEREYAEVLARTRRKPRPESSMLPLISEKEFQQQVKDLARLLGWKTYHTYDSRHSDPDFPDLVMARRRVVTIEASIGGLLVSQSVMKTRLIVVELKVIGKNPTAGQQEWLDFFKQIGAETYVWRPSDLESMLKILK